jgi:hypothetical protein
MLCRIVGHSIYDGHERCFRPDSCWDWCDAFALTCRSDAVLTWAVPSLRRVT